MRSILTDECDAVFVAEGCDDLPAARGIEAGREVIYTYWQPSVEELRQLIAGHAIRLSFLGAMPPVRVDVTEGSVCEPGGTR